MAIEKEMFRQVMGRFATGVTVVTTKSNDVLAGLTVNAFCSVSLNPPLVLICVDNRSNTLDLLRESKKFAVNMLTAEQKDFGRGFATSSPERFEHFCHASHHIAVTGAPIIDNVLAFIDARIVEEYLAGDHTIFIGQVEAMGTAGRVTFMSEEGKEQNTLVDYNGTVPSEDPHPLIYYKGQYRHLTEIYREPSLTSANNTSVKEPTGGR
jgi:flavin reductase (DIM6/NTAB) family NADH-FMN oxidoreductase RutF